MSVVTNDDLDRLIEAEMPSLTTIRHDLHAHPQLGYQETHASGVVKRELSAIGMEFAAGLAETGVVGWVSPAGGAKSRTAIGLRADMDALPIEEETGLGYSSRNKGLMHACGHDGHTTILIGAARVLMKLRDRLPRPVKLVFQPAEEGGAGAERMSREGALDEKVGGLKVTAMFGLHGLPVIPVGMMVTRPGPILASTDVLKVEVNGGGGHAATPHHTADPIVAAAAVITALQSVVSRNVDPVRPAVVTVAAVHGGSTDNVIPDRVTLLGTIRTIEPQTRELVIKRVREIIEGTAAAMGCSAVVKIETGYPVTINDPAVTEYTMKVGRKALGEDMSRPMPQPIMGGEDFSFYGRHAATCFVFIGVKPTGRAEYPGLHTSRFDFTDAAIPVGVKLMVRWALDSGELG